MLQGTEDKMATEKDVSTPKGETVVVTNGEKRLVYAAMLMLQKSVKRANATEPNLQIAGLRDQQIKDINEIMAKFA